MGNCGHVSKRSGKELAFVVESSQKERTYLVIRTQSFNALSIVSRIFLSAAGFSKRISQFDNESTFSSKYSSFEVDIRSNRCMKWTNCGDEVDGIGLGF